MIAALTEDLKSAKCADMTTDEFNQHLEALNLKQSIAATLLRVKPRSVRRWQTGDQEVPANVADLLKAWRQLAKAYLPWTADMESILRGDDDQIERHQDYALELAALTERVRARGGPAAPWRIDLKKHSATLGPMTVSFYLLANGGFSPAHYGRADAAPDWHRDRQLIEDAIAAFAAAVGNARCERPGQNWDE
ncbi:MAG: hypothetical protein ABSC25_22075 [Roseiarcus sp.]